MVNTKILLSVVIVALIGAAAAGYQITTSTPGLWQPTTLQDQQSTDQSNVQSGGSQSGTQGGTTSEGSQSGNGGSNVKISSTQAKSIVQKNYIQQDGAVAGTPKLVTNNGDTYYIVPIKMNGKTQGEIYIDAQTGKNIGGAGGAP